MIFPTICGCRVQKESKVPPLANVQENESSVSSAFDRNVLSLLTTKCGISSWLTHFTVVPTATVNSEGVKVKLWMVTTFVASCAATEATANIAPMIGPISIGTMTERLMANRAVAVQKLVIRVRMSDPYIDRLASCR